jgi:predicted nucleic acid-binding protein
VATASGHPGLIDTDLLIDALRGLPDGIAFVNSQRSASGIHVSIVSAMELIAGCRNAGELGQLQQFLQFANIIPISSPASLAAYQMMKSYFLSHGLIIPDALIAATALEQPMTLFTRNQRHFQMISGLNLVRPY